MMYRQKKYLPLCGICRVPGATTCCRCGVPLCDDHTPEPGKWCQSCEQEFAIYEIAHDTIQRQRWDNLGALLVVIAMFPVAGTLGVVGGFLRWSLGQFLAYGASLVVVLLFTLFVWPIPKLKRNYRMHRGRSQRRKFQQSRSRPNSM